MKYLALSLATALLLVAGTVLAAPFTFDNMIKDHSPPGISSHELNMEADHLTKFLPRDTVSLHEFQKEFRDVHRDEQSQPSLIALYGHEGDHTTLKSEHDHEDPVRNLPEPSTLALASSGLAAIVFARRRLPAPS